MDSSKKGKKANPKKGKTLIKFIIKSDSDSESSEHELSYYVNDRVKLMKEVLKIIKPKKVKSMAPDWMKDMDMEEINSMLLEELLGISNRRLKCIFNGQKPEDDSSSTDPEAEQNPVDVISLDDITDDDFIIDLDSDNSGKHKKHTKGKVQDGPKMKKIKKEKHYKIDKSKPKASDKDKTNEENLMSVLELLELQARARAIRSQLALEHKKKEQLKENSDVKIEDSDNEAIIIESPKDIEIVITSSESENENSGKSDSKSYDSQNITGNASKDDSHKGRRKRSQQSVIKTSNLNKDISHEIQTNETEQSITDTGDKNKQHDSLIQNSSHGFESDIGDNTEDKSNSISACGEKIDVNEESENISKCAEQPEGAPAEANEKILTNEKTTESENITQKYITNGSKQTISENDKAVDKTVKRPTKKIRKRQLRTSNDNSSESEIEESNVTKKQECSKYKKTNKTVSDSIVTKEDQDIKNGVENYNGTDEGDGIVINVDQSEIECIVSD